MQLSKLKTSTLGLMLSVVTVCLHLGIGFYFHFGAGRGTINYFWQYSLMLYWPAFTLVQIFESIVRAGPLTGIVMMIVAALLEWWLIFSIGIGIVRLYCRKPAISMAAKFGIPVAVLVIAVIFFKVASHGGIFHAMSPFEQALTFGDVATLEKQLKANPSLANKKIRYGDTPLNIAVGCQHPKEAIDLLMKYGADINATGEPFDTTPLQDAAWAGKVEAVKALLAYHPDVNALHKDKENTPSGYVWRDTDETALGYAFVADNKEIFNLLLAAGADINRGRSVLAECMVYGGRDSWAEYLLSKGADPNRKGTDADRFVPIIQAVLAGNTNYVAALLKYHVDLNVRYVNGADNFSPLELALDEGHLDVALLIARATLQTHTNSASLAASLGETNLLLSMLTTNPASINETDELGFTPLHWAAETGQKDSAELLLGHGANLEAKDMVGYRPLEWAAYAGHLDLVQLLAAKQLEREKSAKCLNTPLVLAVQQGHVEVAQYLLEQGADANAENSYGRFHHDRPLPLAVQGDSSQMVGILLANGADVNFISPGHESLFHLWAYGHSDLKIADLLIARHADLNATNQEGETPLHLLVRDAAFHGDKKAAIEWLVKHDANVNVRDIHGRTPLDLLTPRHGGVRRKDIADLLQNQQSKK